jgi:hypothetical protein
MFVAKTYEITGRGLAVAIDEVTDVPVRKKLAAYIVRPHGSTLKSEAFKERLVRHSLDPIEGEAFLLLGLTKDDVPVGSDLILTVMQ